MTQICLAAKSHKPMINQIFLPVSPSLSLSLSCSSTAEEKGSDCIDKFKAMQECFQRYPELYKDYDEESQEGTEEGTGEMTGSVMEEEGGRSSEHSTTDGGGSRQLTRTTS